MQASSDVKIVGGGNDDRVSNDGTEDEWNDTDNKSEPDDNTNSRGKRRLHTKKPMSDNKSPAKRNRAMTTDKGPTKKRVKKASKLMNTKTYTKESVLLEFGEESEFGQEYRKMDDDEKRSALDKLNQGATKGIKSVVKEKVLATKYSTLCSEKLKAHLVLSRVDVGNMFRTAPPPSSARTVAAAVAHVGDWVHMDADRSIGWNSEGGIAMVIAVTDNFTDVK
jgi:hypothetical protein